MSLTPQNFQFIQALAKDTAAIILEPGKEYLVESRLDPIARQAGFETLNAFVEQLRVDRKATLFHDQVIDALTTNETSFFRDFYPFETLREDILPRLIQQRAQTRKISIWSAASSTGQELYSIGMVIREHFPQLQDWNVKILGTDLSPSVLARAKEGTYSQLEVSRGLPAALLMRHFNQVGGRWIVKDSIREMIEFKQLNLVKPWPIMPCFDIIFIRNVMIYFDVEAKRSILKRIRGCLHPEGYLLLGGAESTMAIDPHWVPMVLGKTTLYQGKGAVAQAA